MSIRRDATRQPTARLAARLRALCDQQAELLADAGGALAEDDREELRRRVAAVDDFAFSLECDGVGAAHDDHLADMEQ